MSSRAKVTASGRLSLPAEIRRRHGLTRGGEVIIDDRGDAIVLRTVDQVVARAQALARRMIEGKQEAGVDDFLAERRREAERE